jgi:amidophosphoribosyltransferase
MVTCHNFVSNTSPATPDHPSPVRIVALVGASDMIKEACGVFGVRAPAQPVSHLTYLGLYSLQHRGQESAGIAVADGRKIWVDKGMGLVATIFDDHRLAALAGHTAIGHTRYSTTGASEWDNAQPVYCDAKTTQFAIAHNGNLVNTGQLAAESHLDLTTAASDSHVIAALLTDHIATSSAHDVLLDAITDVLPRLQGAFSLVILDEDRLIGVRDPHGFRPLFLGQLDHGGHVLASETPALDVIGATVVREVEPGEVIIIDATGPRSIHPFPPAPAHHLCVFEFVYISRPDGKLRGTGIHGARHRMGQQLAIQAPAEADLVVPIPESGIPGAQGYAAQSGIPYATAFIKNAYIGRTFIAPTQELRSRAVRIKLNPVEENVAGKRLVVVEDSLVRATTLRETLRMLRHAGAAEIHLRICSPPYRWPCFYGMDTADRSRLIAADRDVEAIRGHLEADSLAYLELDGMLDAIGTGRQGYCAACLTGDYPVPVPDADGLPHVAQA